MAAMPGIESAFCRSALWRGITRRIVLPWALLQADLEGEVLEIGAGSGTMARELLATRPHLRMTVTDADPMMVDVASKQLAGFTDRVSVTVADATALPFRSDTFDAVLSFLMLHHTVRWEEALSESVRVLRPGGSLLGYDLLSRWPARAMHRLEGAPHRLISLPELRSATSHLPLTDARLRTGIGGSVVRFSYRKPTQVK